MSSSLEASRTIHIKVGLSDTLKLALRKRSEGGHVCTDFSQRSINYLEGLRDAGIGDAQKLIDLIIKHDTVHVEEVY